MRSPERARLAMLLSVTFACILTSCGHLTRTAAIEPPEPPPAPTFCAVVKPIIFSRLHDTEETIAQIKVLNAKYDELCPA